MVQVAVLPYHYNIFLGWKLFTCETRLPNEVYTGYTRLTKNTHTNIRAGARKKDERVRGREGERE